MKLLYKQHILNELQHITIEHDLFAEFWKKELFAYVKALGLDCNDYYKAIQFLVLLNDNKYCGILNSREPIDGIHYYVYDGQDDTIYWFKCAGDAFYFVANGNQVMFRPQDGDAFASAFEEKRCTKEDGWLWLTENDFNYIDVANSTIFYHCIEMNKDFLSIEDAAKWLVETSKAANTTAAIRSLRKHLDGETKKCYGLTWKIN